jgi:hypothetical protein
MQNPPSDVAKALGERIDLTVTQVQVGRRLLNLCVHTLHTQSDVYGT